MLKYCEHYQSVTHRNEVSAIGKRHQRTCAMQGCHKPSIRKKRSIYEFNKTMQFLHCHMWPTHLTCLGGYPKAVGEHLLCARHSSRGSGTQRWKRTTTCAGEVRVLVKRQTCTDKTPISWKRCCDWGHGWGSWELRAEGDISVGSWRMRRSCKGWRWHTSVCKGKVTWEGNVQLRNNEVQADHNTGQREAIANRTTKTFMSSLLWRELHVWALFCRPAVPNIHS